MKRILLIFIALCLVFGLFACSTPSKPDPEPSAQPSDTPAPETKLPAEPSETPAEPSETPAETTPEEYADHWFCEESGIFLDIRDDMTWAAYDRSINYIDGGTCRLEDGYGLVLGLSDDTDYDFLKFGEDGKLYNSCFYEFIRCSNFLLPD